jgi:hypothetical protein
MIDPDRQLWWQAFFSGFGLVSSLGSAISTDLPPLQKPLQKIRRHIHAAATM